MKSVDKNNNPLIVKGKGNMKFKTNFRTDDIWGVLRDNLYVPGIGVNLFSVGNAADGGAQAIFLQDLVRFYRNK